MYNLDVVTFMASVLEKTRAVYCNPPLIGQYVTINIPGYRKILTFCEIEVYNTTLASTLFLKLFQTYF